MKDSQFYTWLVQQKRRPDPIGDLAEDIIRDKTFPKTRGTKQFLINYLKSKGASPDVIDVLKLAFKEYQG